MGRSDHWSDDPASIGVGVLHTWVWTVRCIDVNSDRSAGGNYIQIRESKTLCHVINSIANPTSFL